MKKLLATAIATTLLVSATGAALAQPYRGNGHGYGHYDRYDRGYHHDNTGAAIGIGLGLFALGAILAASQNRHERDYYAAPPPPPPYGYGYDGYYYRR